MSKKLDRIIQKRKIIREKNNRLEDLILEALELGAPTIVEVVDYVSSHCEFETRSNQVRNMTYKIMGVSEYDKTTPHESDCILL